MKKNKSKILTKRQFYTEFVIILMSLLILAIIVTACNRMRKTDKPDDTTENIATITDDITTSVESEEATTTSVETRAITDYKFEELSKSGKVEWLCAVYPKEIESDIYYLTCFLYGECRGSDQTMQSCCAWAILNYLGKDKPGNLHKTVKYYSDGSYWSSYITSFGRYRWVRSWTITEGKKAGKIEVLRADKTTVQETHPKTWEKCKNYATDVYRRWLQELAGYTSEEVGRTLPKNYIHFWVDKKNGYSTITFPENWATRYDHSKDFKIDYKNSPYNVKEGE